VPTKARSALIGHASFFSFRSAGRADAARRYSRPSQRRRESPMSFAIAAAFTRTGCWRHKFRYAAIISQYLSGGQAAFANINQVNATGAAALCRGIDCHGRARTRRGCAGSIEPCSGNGLPDHLQARQQQRKLTLRSLDYDRLSYRALSATSLRLLHRATSKALRSSLRGRPMIKSGQVARASRTQVTTSPAIQSGSSWRNEAARRN